MPNYSHLRVANLEPGDEITALEGVDLQGERAVVVDLVPSGSATTVTLLFPDLKVSRKFKVPSSSLSKVEHSKSTKPSKDVVDSLRASDPDRVVPPIRDGVPDSYFPPDVNGTQPTMTDVLWRPTVRRTPFTRGLQAGTRRRAKTTGYDFDTFPALDFPPQRDQEHQRSSTGIDDGYEDGSPLRPRRYNKPYETRYLRSQNPVVDPSPDLGTWTSAKQTKLQELADLFWSSYKEIQLTKLPSRPGLGHSGMHLDDWATIWLQETNITVAEMDELWHYMIATRQATATAYRAWKDKLRQNMLHPTRTPQYDVTPEVLPPVEVEEETPKTASTRRLAALPDLYYAVVWVDEDESFAELVGADPEQIRQRAEDIADWADSSGYADLHHSSVYYDGDVVPLSTEDFTDMIYPPLLGQAVTEIKTTGFTYVVAPPRDYTSPEDYDPQTREWYSPQASAPPRRRGR